MYQYFNTRAKGTSLDSTGFNFAPAVNDAMVADQIVNHSSEYSWRIYKCGNKSGSTETGYNIFVTLDSVSTMNVSDHISTVVKYNTDTKISITGSSKVAAKVVEGTTIHYISGGDFKQ